MAKFVYDARGDHPSVTLEATQDEEIPTEIAQAWAALQQANALLLIADAMAGLDNSVTARLSDIADKMP